LSGTIKTDGYQESIICALKKGWAAGFPPDNMVYIIILEEPILPVSHDGISFRQATSMGMMIIKINVGVLLFVIDASSVPRFLMNISDRYW
jgi:hypothetical protein